MLRSRVIACASAGPPRVLNRQLSRAHKRPAFGKVVRSLAAGAMMAWTSPAGAVVLWNDPEATLVNENGAGSDILGGAVKRDDSANDTLYFKFHVDPLSDQTTEDYFA